MSTAIEEFNEMCELINEISGNYAPASGAIAAGSESPRKDFGVVGGNGYPPGMNRGSLLDPYQSHPSSTMPDPTRSAHLPFPLEGINDLLADSYVHLFAALKQIKTAVQNNKSIDPVFKKELVHLHKQGSKALHIIKKVGERIEVPANLNY